MVVERLIDEALIESVQRRGSEKAFENRAINLDAGLKTAVIF